MKCKLSPLKVPVLLSHARSSDVCMRTRRRRHLRRHRRRGSPPARLVLCLSNAGRRFTPRPARAGRLGPRHPQAAQRFFEWDAHHPRSHTSL